MLGRAGDSGRISLPDIGDIRIELEFIAIRIEDVQTVGDGMIGCADDSDIGFLEFFESLSEFFIGIPDF